MSEWLRARRVRSAEVLAAKAVTAVKSQMATLPGEQMAARLVAQLAEGMINLTEQIKDIDRLIEDRFHRHPSAEVITSQPGIGVLLGAEFLAATGGDIDRFGSADRLASFAGVTPVPRDSGRVNGNLHRPQRYNRALQRVFYTSALISVRCCPDSRRFYDCKRTEGKRPGRAGPGQTPRQRLVGPAAHERIYQLTPPLAAVA